ncbi:MAG: hypothetical protein AAB489_04370 [Patescibacteria group bacterium]
MRVQRSIAGILTTILLLGATGWLVPGVKAETTAPLKHVYNGHLLDSSGNAITTAHKVRFSYWTSADYVSGDVTATGAINTGASAYASWNEVFTVTPDSRGYFSVQLGSGTALPVISSQSANTLKNLHLQVEVKSGAAADTSYEVLDRDANDPTVDRSPVLSVPSALNADMIDRRDVGTGSGSIPVLGSGGLLETTQIPAGTSQDRFTIDNDSSAADTVTLRFGQSINQTLTFDVASDRFDFNDDLRVQGNLTVTGLVNGVDIGSLTNAYQTHLRVTSGAGLNVNIAAGSYRINGVTTNYAGVSSQAVANNATNYVFLTSTGLTISIGTYPTNRSYIPLAEVVTSGGAISTVTDRRVLSSDDRERTVEQFLHAEYPMSSYKPDETNNVGQLSVTNNTGSLRNHYVWTSTKSSLQDYDISVRVTVPSDFIRWKDNSLHITYASSSADSLKNQLDIAVFDTAGNAVTLSGSSVDLASTSWTTTQLEFGASSTWTVGQDFLIRMKLHAKDLEQMKLSDLKLQFIELHEE